MANTYQWFYKQPCKLAFFAFGAKVIKTYKLGPALAFRYQYDQLNRLLAMQTFKQPNGTADTSHDYKEAVTYDPNGNIKTYLRNGAGSDRGLTMDNLTYNYNVSGGRLQKNQLVRVTDAATGMYTEDIKTQTNAVNYEYDAIGNLIKDKQDSIDIIKWTVYGKIESITKLNGSTLHYTYDASGNRIEKKYTKSGVDHYTWYVRDAQGNTMAVYEKTNSTAVRLTETHLYGSSRLGMAKELTKKPINANAVNAPSNAKVYTFTRGEKFFELSNHLGNVLAVIADKKLPVASIGGMAINYWQADVVTATGYYPFGMPMPARTGKTYNGTWVPGRGFSDGGLYPTDLSVAQRYAPRPANYVATRQIELLPGFETGLTDEMIAEIINPTDNPNGSTGTFGGEGSYEAYGYYRYGFNGKENDNEVKGAGNQQDYGMRIYDPRLGRFLSVDPVSSTYPWWTPYQFCGNSPIAFIDIDGQELSENLKSWGVDLSPAAAGFVDGLTDGISYIAMGKMVYNLSTDSKYREDFVEAIKTAATDPVGFVKMIAEDYKNKFQNIMEFNDDGKYDLGYIAGELTGRIVTGGAIALLVKYTSKFKLLNKVTKEAKDIGEDVPVSKRPTWQQSEKDIVTSDYGEQVSFKNGEIVRDKSKGSVRPEGYKTGQSIEVKNYKLTSEKGIKAMLANVVKQVRQRQSNLPKNTIQNIVLDIRGQNLNANQMLKIRSRLMTQTGSKNINISFKTD